MGCHQNDSLANGYDLQLGLRWSCGCCWVQLTPNQDSCCCRPWAGLRSARAYNMLRTGSSSAGAAEADADVEAEVDDEDDELVRGEVAKCKRGFPKDAIIHE